MNQNGNLFRLHKNYLVATTALELQRRSLWPENTRRTNLSYIFYSPLSTRNNFQSIYQNDLRMPDVVPIEIKEKCLMYNFYLNVFF